MRRHAGERWCDKVLRHGGARDPHSLMHDMLSEGGAEAAAAGMMTHGEEEDDVEDAILNLTSIAPRPM